MTTRTDPTYESNVPNLDGMDEDELLRFAAHAAADELFPKYPSGHFPLGHIGMTTSLREYAGMKRRAMRLRAFGNLAAARRCENAADRIYDSLPAIARW